MIFIDSTHWGPDGISFLSLKSCCLITCPPSSVVCGCPVILSCLTVSHKLDQENITQEVHLWQAFPFYCRTAQITLMLSWVIQHGLEVWNLYRKWSRQVINWHQKTWCSGLSKHLRGWTVLWTQNALEIQQILTGNLTKGWFPMKFLVLCFLSDHECHENSFCFYI